MGERGEGRGEGEREGGKERWRTEGKGMERSAIICLHASAFEFPAKLPMLPLLCLCPLTHLIRLK